MTPPAGTSSAWDRFWFGFAVESGQLALFRVVFFGLVGLDAWLELVHAPRYGAGGFNVPHFGFLAALPAPPRQALVVLNVVQLFLSALLASGAGGRRANAALAAVFGATYFCSQLDSYQHRYLLFLLLLVTSFHDWRPASTLRPRAPVPSWALRLVLVQMSVVYLWAAFTKLHPLWLDGTLMSRQVQARWFQESVAQVAERLGSAPATLWAGLASGVLVTELALAVGLLLPWRAARLVAAAVGMGFHLGIEYSGFQIGLFSYYMVALYLLVAPDVRSAGALATAAGCVVAWELGSQATVVALVAGGLVLAVARFGRSPAMERQGGLVLSVGLAVGALAAWWVPLEGMPAAIAVAACLALANEWPWRPGRAARGLAFALGGLCIAVLHAETDVVRDYYRYLGGDTRRRNLLPIATDAYRKVTELDPDYAPGWARLGDLYLRADDAERAQTAYQAGLERARGDADLWAGLAEARLRAGDRDGARQAVDQALKLNPKHRMALQVKEKLPR